MTSLAPLSRGCAAPPMTKQQPRNSRHGPFPTFFTGLMPRFCPARYILHSRKRLDRAHAFRATDKVQDWRVQKMVDLVRLYVDGFLCKGQEHLADAVFDDSIVHVDNVWDPAHPTAGVEGMKHYLHDLRMAFPDFFIEIGDIAACDMNSLMVSYSGTATGLGQYHDLQRPTRHVSPFSGINLVRFNFERTKIVEIQVYRTAFAEDKLELGEAVAHGEGGFRELRLRRLA